MRVKSPAKEIDPILAQVVKYLNKGTDAKSLWDVLTALRGPDAKIDGLPDTIIHTGFSMDEVKDATTCVLRYALGLQYGIKNGHGDSYWFSLHPDSKKLAEYRKTIPYGHFRNHAEDAFRALGLSWSKINHFPADKKKTARKRGK